ncbi:MAG: glycosyl hydrolase family 18 protein [Polyangiaceae bacterium]
MAGALLVAGSGTAAAQEMPMMSIHEAELRMHEAEPLLPRRLPDARPQPRTVQPERVVYGYYPFWVADLTTIRWSALTHLAWFSIDLDAQGNIVSKHGWPDEDVVAEAHAAGVRVDVTFTLFGGSDITALCNSPTRRASTIATIVSEMEAGNADGVSIDFEFVGGAARDGFTAFMQELRAALDDAGHPDAQISMAAPTVDWGQGLDMQALFAVTDWFFVMGYGYFWSGSANAGPTGMLRVTADWAPVASLSMLRTLATYSTLLTAEQRKQIIWGVPYYGREYVTTSSGIGASAIDQMGAVTYSAARADLAAGGVEAMYHEGVQNPWYRWQQGGNWRQVWYDDERSLAAKYDLAFDQGLGGVGMWALNYDAPHAELWDLLDDVLVGGEMVPEGHRDAPIVVDTLPYHDERDTTVGASQYFNYYSCSPNTPEFGREWVYQLDVCQPGTVIASVPVYPDRDPDLHLLSAPDQDACLARDDSELSQAVEPGRYLLVVDTYVDMPVEREGAYALDLDFVPDPGSEGCADYLTCDAGSCVCGDGLTDCGDACVDTESDADHCGACGNACDSGETCAMGACVGGTDGSGGGAGEGGGASNDIEGEGSVGCSCRVAGRRSSSRDLPFGLAALALLGLAWRRRRTAV